ncbi:MAG: hypothetical protein FWC39_06200 [Bacteroidetes bacterium]|nr:hypothetical protein [Bacteroidota bacterium]
MTKKIYIYPTYTPNRDGSVGNLYIKHFHDAFDTNSNFSLVNRKGKIGITSLFFNLDADLFVIQWVDLIIHKQYGKIQFLFFLMGMITLRILNKKIIWVLHNKSAHKGESKLVDFAMKLMAKYSKIVITHSSEGVTFFNEKYRKKYGEKAHYISHPVYSADIIKSEEIQWDYIIWGGVNERSRVAEFLSFVKDNPFFATKKIVICGYCPDAGYKNKVLQNVTPNITFINEFLPDEKLAHYIARSGCVLFTYNPASVLSSGAMIHSLNFCKPMIAPNVGNFRDMEGAVYCYDTFEDIPLFDYPLTVDSKVISEYIEENTWAKFSGKIFTLIR